MRKMLFRALIDRPLTEAAPAPERRRSRRTGAASRPRRAPTARPEPRHPRGRRRLLQRLRAGDSRAQQRLLRPGAVRHPLRRLAQTRRRPARHRPGHPQHAGGAGPHVRGDARSEVGGGGRRLRLRRRHLRREAMPSRAVSRPSFPSTCTFAAARRRPSRCFEGCCRF